MKRFFFMFILLLCAISVQAQNTLDDQEIANFKKRCEEKIETFQHGLEIIGNKSRTTEVRRHYVRNVLKLFIGEGNAYQLQDGEHEPAQMQVSSKNSQGYERRTRMPIKVYLNRLLDMKQYTSVTITKAKTLVLSNFYKVGNHYEATATIYQYFKGQGRDGYCYRDQSEKQIKVYLFRVNDGVLGSYWDVKFGDIDVVETIRL